MESLVSNILTYTYSYDIDVVVMRALWNHISIVHHNKRLNHISIVHHNKRHIIVFFLYRIPYSIELLISTHPVKIKFYSDVSFILETELNLGLTVVFNGLHYNFCRSIPHKCSAQGYIERNLSVRRLPGGTLEFFCPGSTLRALQDRKTILRYLIGTWLTAGLDWSIQHPQLGAFVSVFKICFPQCILLHTQMHNILYK